MLSFIKIPVIYVRVIALAHLDVAKRSVKFIIGIIHGMHIYSWSQHSIYHGLQQKFGQQAYARLFIARGGTNATLLQIHTDDHERKTHLQNTTQRRRLVWAVEM